RSGGGGAEILLGKGYTITGVRIDPDRAWGCGDCHPIRCLDHSEIWRVVLHGDDERDPQFDEAWSEAEVHPKLIGAVGLVSGSQAGDYGGAGPEPIAICRQRRGNGG